MNLAPSAPAPGPASARLFTPVLIAGCGILILSFGVRSAFGLFQVPLGAEFGWGRSEYSLAIAIQNLAWGFGQPLFAAVAERYGDRKVLALGAAIYAGGLLLSAFATTPEAHQAINLVIGMGIAGTGLGVILAVVGRASSDANRSMALGIAAAAGSVGQIVGPPFVEFLLAWLDWRATFLVLAGVVTASVLLLPMIRAPEPASRSELEESMGTVLLRAFRDPSYALIFLGFFSCGYQVAFLTAHFPAFVTEVCSPINPTGALSFVGLTTTSQLGAWSISLIGAANIVGTLIAGRLGGGPVPKKYLLAWIYFGRTIVSAVFILMPMTPASVVAFSVTMGVLWLATVPLTSGLVAYIYGVRYMGTLFGIVFLSHQLGSFLGVWLGGVLYDLYGTYDQVWWLGIGIGLFSALIQLPIREEPGGGRRLAAA